MSLTRVLLVRHADVENPGRVLYGQLPGFPLSARGRVQATALGERLRRAGLQRIVHSPQERAAETARLIAAQLEGPLPLVADPRLREADFSRYLQGVPYWQVPIRRPLWFVHKARRGLLPGDETVAEMGGRVLEVVRQLARELPGGAAACIGHADPLQAAWVLLEGRAQSERELYRKQFDRAGVLRVELEGEIPVRWDYERPPMVEVPARPAA
ncbi:MAG TPA: histidine phosphatase family protein [Candidatus Acidoferrales bacterium]|nr:histidine phosphatase family protein [Candidatus Acidoferrales bacterium]